MKFKLNKEKIKEIYENKDQTVFELQEAGLIVRTKDNSSKEVLWYLDTNKVLGKGCDGIVFPAYPINSKGEIEVDSSAQYVGKVFSLKDNAEKKIREEAKKTSQFYRTMQPVFFEDKAYIITKRLPGSTMNFFKKKLSLSEAVRLMKEICFEINNIHRKLIVHGDIHPDNLLIKRLIQDELKEKYSKYIYNISFIDFGLSSVYQCNDDELYKDGSFDDLKLDIFKLGVIFEKIFLMQEDEDIELFFKKVKKFIYYVDVFDIFKLEMTFEPENNKEDIDIELFKKTKEFIERMVHIDYHKRPTSTEVLNFFVALDNLLTIYKLPKEEQKQYKEEIDDYIERINFPGKNSSRRNFKLEKKVENAEVKQSEESILYRLFNSCLNSEALISDEKEKKCLLN